MNWSNNLDEKVMRIVDHLPRIPLWFLFIEAVLVFGFTLVILVWLLVDIIWN